MRILRATIAALLLGAAAGCVVFGSHSLDAPPREDVWIGPVTVVVPAELRLPDRWIHVSGGRVVSVDEVPPAGVDTIWSGGFVLPGLIDLHVHFSPRIVPGSANDFARLFLLHGVTSVREAGSIDGAAFWIRDQIDAGKMAGPRIFSCGSMLDGEPPLQVFARVVRDPTDAEDAVSTLVEEGADCIKVYENLSPDSLAAIAESAKNHGLPVIGHVPRGGSLAEGGIDEVQHVTGILPRPLEANIANPEWLSELARRFREVDDEAIQAYVRESAAQGIRHTPTLVSFLRDSEQANYAVNRESDAAQLLPRYWRDVLWNADSDERFRGLTPDTWIAFRESLERRQEIVKLLHDAGVPILTGTDTPNPFVVPGAGLHDELRLLVAAGLTIEDAWVAATHGAGRALGVEGLGRIESGAPADLLWFSEDPTQDLDSLGTLSAVVVDSRVYPIAELTRATEERRRQYESTVYDRLSSAVVRIGAAFFR
jgi:imidazolonepropionase-like amidohydrolase